MRAPDARLERRMGREAPPAPERLREEHVREKLAVQRAHGGVRAQRQDRVERARDRLGIARELHARRVGEQLALARDRGLDGVGGERAGKADEGDERAAHREQRLPAPLFALLRLKFLSHLEDHVLARVDQPLQAGEQAHQAHVERHVAVEDVAELVAHHALQLVAREPGERAARDDDHRLVGRIAGDQGVDRLLALQAVQRRHGDARGDRHLLDHVEQAPLGRAAVARLDVARAEQVGDRGASVPQLPDAPRRNRDDAASDQQRDAGEQLARRLHARAPVEREQRVEPCGDGAVARDHRGGGGEIPQDEPARPAARALLLLEEVQAS